MVRLRTRTRMQRRSNSFPGSAGRAAWESRGEGEGEGRRKTAAFLLRRRRRRAARTRRDARKRSEGRRRRRRRELINTTVTKAEGNSFFTTSAPRKAATPRRAEPRAEIRLTTSRSPPPAAHPLADSPPAGLLHSPSRVSSRLGHRHRHRLLFAFTLLVAALAQNRDSESPQKLIFDASTYGPL